MAPVDQDLAARVLGSVVRVMPAGRREWGRAMQAELAAIEDRADRRSFARGCLRAAAVQVRLLRGTLHLLAVLATLATLLAWTATVDYPPLSLILYVVVSILAVVCWAARRAGMLGPIGDSAGAWLLRVCGYLIAGGIAATAVAHARPETVEAVDDGIGILVLATMAAGFVIGLVAVCARQSAATARVLITGIGGGLTAGLIWLVAVLVVPPIPASVGWALALTAVATVTAVLVSPARGRLLAGLLAAAITMVSIFVGVVGLAHWGPDSAIPAITPFALPANRISESRIEIVDPYMLILVLSGLAATALSLAALVTRRPAVETRSRG